MTKKPQYDVNKTKKRWRKRRMRQRNKLHRRGQAQPGQKGKCHCRKLGIERSREKPSPKSPTEEESSPDMVAVILGEAREKTPRPKKQQPATAQIVERPVVPVVAATSRVQEPPQAKARIPPPESARVSAELLRERTEENRRRAQQIEWQNWENATKKHLKVREQLQARDATAAPEVRVETATRKEELSRTTATESQEKQEQSQPLTPLIPVDEPSLGDGSTTEELEGENDERLSGEERQPSQAATSYNWHKNTRPAEPKMPKRRKPSGEETKLKLEQIAYLTMWMQQEKGQRQAWEREPLDEETDVNNLAREMQTMDEQLGKGATLQCIRSQLTEWGIQGVEDAGPQDKTLETPLCKM